MRSVFPHMYNDDMLVSRTEVEFTLWNLHSFVNKVIVMVLPPTFFVKIGKMRGKKTKKKEKRENPGHTKTRLDSNV